MKIRSAAIAIAALHAAIGSLQAYASHAPGHAIEDKAQSALVGGEVRRIDKEAGKITLKHDAIPNLDMTAMTMVFRVKEPSMLEAVKEGDKVRFRADKVQGLLTITEINSVR